MIPAGTYEAQAISDAVFSKSSKKGTEQVVVTLAVITAEGGGSIDWISYLSEAAIGRTTEALIAMGYDFANNASVRTNKVSIVVEHEEYEGQLRARVKWVNSLDTAARYNVMTGTEESLVKARLKAAALSLKAKQGPRVAKTADAGTPFDDIV